MSRSRRDRPSGLSDGQQWTNLKVCPYSKVFEDRQGVRRDFQVKTSYRFILLFIVIIIIVFSNNARAVQFDATDTKVDLPTLAIPHNAVAPHMSSDENDHVYVVWSDNRGGPYKVYFNAKFGESGWAPQSTPVNTGFPKSAGVDKDGDATFPQVCSDNSGHVYVVWVDDRAVKAGTGKKDIYFRYSKDYGTSWNAPDSFTDYRIDSDNPGPGDSINPRIACDETGNVYIVWEDDRNRSGVYDIYFRSLNVQFSKPTDFITPYQFPEYRINTGVTAGFFKATNPVISTDKNGTVYVAWRDDREIPEDKVYHGIYFNSSNNHGQSWKETALRVDTAPVGFYSTGPPAMSNDMKGSVYIAWADTAGRATRGTEYAGDGTYDVYFNVSRNYGLTWGAADKRINFTKQPAQLLRVIGARDVSIANNDKGVVCIVWADNTLSVPVGGRKDNFDIYVNHSENFGGTFLDFVTEVRVNVNTEPGKTAAYAPKVKVNNIGGVFVSWADNRQGANDIFFNYSINKGKDGSWQDKVLWLDNARPYGNSLFYEMTTNEKGHVYLTWQDDRSTLVKDNFNIYFISGFLDIELFLLEGGQKIGEACFIATAAYGSPLERHVVLLRDFRDTFLLTNRYGMWFVNTYYKLSPPAAQFISGHPYLKPVVRVALLPFVGIAALALKTTLLQKLILAVSITIVLFISRRKLKTQ
ncbi:MAG TPA: sialidase family protein [Nitrospirota bacterium]|nr:sialidase family protein [Nitrospirota bacterium]